MAASDQTRLIQVEHELALLRRDLAAVEARPAEPHTPTHGWYLGVFNEELEQGGTAEFEFLLWSEGEWVRSGITKTVQDFYLNVDESIAADTKGEAAWYYNVWVARNAKCNASDTLPEE